MKRFFGNLSTTTHHFLVTLAVAAGLTCCGMVNPAVAVTVTQHFNSDPGWDGVNNTFGFNNFGFSNTNNVGAAAGEAGGVLDRGGKSAYYAGTASGLNGNTALSATGRYGWDEVVGETARDDGAWYFGWFDSNYPDTQALPNSALAFYLNSRNQFATVVTGGNQTGILDLMTDSKPPAIDGCTGNEDGTAGNLCSGPTGGKNFSMQYNPSGGVDGQLSIVVTTDDPVWNAAHSSAATYDLTAAERTFLNGASLNHFGIFNENLSEGGAAGQQTRLYIDDVTYEAGTVPEPASLLLIGLGAALVLPARRRRRPLCSDSVRSARI